MRTGAAMGALLALTACVSGGSPEGTMDDVEIGMSRGEVSQILGVSPSRVRTQTRETRSAEYEHWQVCRQPMIGYSWCGDLQDAYRLMYVDGRLESISRPN